MQDVGFKVHGAWASVYHDTLEAVYHDTLEARVRAGPSAPHRIPLARQHS